MIKILKGSELLTKQIQWVILAYKEWQDVKTEKVTKGLNKWKCGTQACFGGSLPFMPSFSFIKSFNDGFPYIPSHIARNMGLPSNYLNGAVMSEVIFGDEDLFHPVKLKESRLDLTDHEIVSLRLLNQLEKLVMKQEGIEP